MKRRFWVYILTNRTRTVLYTGVTNDLDRRMREHRTGFSERSFAKRYKADKLVFVEEYEYPGDAIYREKQIKSGSRADKIELIQSLNPEWNDLAKDWE